MKKAIECKVVTISIIVAIVCIALGTTLICISLGQLSVFVLIITYILAVAFFGVAFVALIVVRDILRHKIFRK